MSTETRTAQQPNSSKVKLIASPPEKPLRNTTTSRVRFVLLALFGVVLTSAIYEYSQVEHRLELPPPSTVEEKPPSTNSPTTNIPEHYFDCQFGNIISLGLGCVSNDDIALSHHNDLPCYDELVDPNDYVQTPSFHDLLTHLRVATGDGVPYVRSILCGDISPSSSSPQCDAKFGPIISMTPARAWGGIHDMPTNNNNNNAFAMQHDVLLGPFALHTLPPTTDMMMSMSPHHLTLMCPSADAILRHELSPACTAPPSAKWFVVPSPRCDTTQWVLSMPNGEISLSSDRHHNIWLLTSPHTTGVDGKILTGSWSNVQQKHHHDLKSSLSEYIPPLMSGNQLERVIVHWYAVITSVNPLRVLVLRDGWVTIHGNTLTMPDPTTKWDNNAVFQNLLEQELELARGTNVTTADEETNTQRAMLLKTWMDERFFSEESRASFRQTIVAAVRLRVLHFAKQMRQHQYQHANARGAGARCAAVIRFDVAVTSFGAMQAKPQIISQDNPYTFVDFTAVVLAMRLDYSVLQPKSPTSSQVENDMKYLVLQGVVDALVIRKPTSTDNGGLTAFRRRTFAVQRLVAFFCTVFGQGDHQHTCTRKEAVELTRMVLELQVTQANWQMLIPILTDNAKRDTALRHDENSLLTVRDAHFTTLMQRWETNADKLKTDLSAWDESTKSVSLLIQNTGMRL